MIVQKRAPTRVGLQRKFTAVAASVVAGVGMLGIALSRSPVWLSIFVVLAGTSAGVALSGSAALAIGADWRFVFTIFASTAFALALAAFSSLPRPIAPQPV